MKGLSRSSVKLSASFHVDSGSEENREVFLDFLASSWVCA